MNVDDDDEIVSIHPNVFGSCDLSHDPSLGYCTIIWVMLCRVRVVVTLPPLSLLLLTSLLGIKLVAVVTVVVLKVYVEFDVAVEYVPLYDGLIFIPASCYS